ncbi:MAG: hypothetical protein A3E79_04365 [Burkholderiales bacterium RIFCSPHIGHO2_12_FULL_61_11]|nr:MAG: hypothetical protein A3E79_04365 [Burkholderiales bacterium RIFCSPHIGHO2_12_FULL_61_11]
MAGGRAIDSGLLLALAAVAAITVTAAARAGLTVLALFWPFRRNQNIGGGCQNHRVAGLVQAIHDARVCGVKTVGLGTDGGRGAAVGAFATTLVATATALATAFTATFAAAFSTATWLAFAITADLLSSTLGGFILALSASFATHGRSHGSLIGQCQILLDGIARDALATLTAVTALAAVALATDFAVLIARLLVGSYFASDFSAAFTATLGYRTFLTAALGACFRMALTAFSATALVAAVTASFGAAFTTAFTAATATATAITATALAAV